MIPRLDLLKARFDAILIDLDGTLLDGEARTTARTVRAVKALVDAGILVLLCTGRSVAGTRPHHEALGLTTPVVTYNGSWIGDPGAEPEHYLPIPDEHLRSIFRAERDAHFSFRHRAEWKYTVRSDHPEHRAVSSWFHSVVHADDHAELPDNDLMRVSMFFDARDLDEDGVRQRFLRGLPPTAREALRVEAFPLSMFPTYEASTLLLCEVQGHSCGKAEAFGWLEATRGISRARTIAVGDHMNDLTMLAGAGLAVCPANAVPQARAHAHLIIGHHAKEGLAAWIEAGAPVPGNRRAPIACPSR